MRWTYVPPVLYLAFALYAWVDFTYTAHDGLANLGLMLATWPVAAIGVALTWALGRTGFVLIPSGLGYYTAHAIYFWPAALLTAALLYGVCSALDWLWQWVLRGAQSGADRHQRERVGEGARQRD
jgi:prepilin signal peptidase PulO-like enzyme (type II secretory pathway)